MEEQEAILFERLSGIPVLRIPNEVFDAAAAGDALAASRLDAYKKIATNVRIDEQMGLVLPSDRWPGNNGPSSEPMFDFQLVTPQAGRSNVNSDNAITRYNVNMMTSVLADFLTLGHEARGSQSLAVTKVDLFFQAIEGFLNGNADVIDRYGLERLWDLNGMDHDLRPKIVPDLAQRVDLDVLSNYILRMSQAGMPMFPDPDLETWVRDAAGLPDIAEEGADRAAQLGQSTANMAQPDQLSQNPVEKMIRASLARRFKRMNGANGSTKRGRRSKRSAIQLSMSV